MGVTTTLTATLRTSNQLDFPARPSAWRFTKREEWNAYNRTVSQWELDNYIALY